MELDDSAFGTSSEGGRRCGAASALFMIESVVTAAALNVGQLVRGQEASNEATWNAIRLADFSDSGVAFVAIPARPSPITKRP